MHVTYTPPTCALCIHLYPPTYPPTHPPIHAYAHTHTYTRHITHYTCAHNVQEENDVGDFYLSLEKDPQQEEFLQGRMQGNPYPSTTPGLGPLMRDVKNKICTGERKKEREREGGR